MTLRKRSLWRRMQLERLKSSLTPQPPEDKAEGATLGRMSGDKQFHGDIEGTSKLQMLTAMTDVKGSAGYVAIERVTGTLHGRSGSFVLQHSGNSNRGATQLSHHGGAGFGHWPTGWHRRQDDDYHHRRKTFVRLRVHAPQSSVTKGRRATQFFLETTKLIS